MQEIMVNYYYILRTEEGFKNSVAALSENQKVIQKKKTPSHKKNQSKTHTATNLPALKMVNC